MPSTAPTAAAVLDGGPAISPAPRVLERFDAQVAAGAERIALVHGERRLTYGQLALAVALRADELAQRGAGPGRLVAVCRPRGTDAVVGLLAALRTGAAYLPLDPAAPGARNAAILADCSGSAEVPGEGEHVLPGAGVPEDAAYVIYTSGSTGTPNGVVVGHGALGHFVAGALDRYGITAEDRVLQFAPLHFDASVEELFLSLGSGARLVLRDEEMLDVPGLLAGCEEHGITVLDLPTAYWHELAHALACGTAALPPALRTVVIGGEAALPERVAQWRRAVDGGRVRLLNTYGPTEATVVATVADLSRYEGGPVPIGAPLPGVRAAVVDGELWLLGGGLAHGYLGRPELTAHRFTALDGERAYRTGDLVRVRPDGLLGFLGRADDEVKINGHRVDPASVESVLTSHPGVREAAVVPQDTADGARRLAAFVYAGEGVSAAELRALVRAELPAAAVPGTLTLTAGPLPRTSSGKIDRKSLRGPHGPGSRGHVHRVRRTGAARRGPGAAVLRAAAAVVPRGAGGAVGHLQPAGGGAAGRGARHGRPGSRARRLSWNGTRCCGRCTRPWTPSRTSTCSKHRRSPWPYGSARRRSSTPCWPPSPVRPSTSAPNCPYGPSSS